MSEKHPQDEWVGLDEDIQNQLASVDSSTIAAVDKCVLRDIIKKCKLTVRPGLDKLRYEHVKALAGYCSESSIEEDVFCDRLASILTLIIRGDIPEPISHVLSDNELIAIPKGPADIRPIGIGSTLRKLAALVIMRRLNSFNNEHFKNFQFGMQRNGMEHIILESRLRC